MSLQQRLARLEAKSQSVKYQFNNTPYFKASDYIITGDGKQPSNRTVSNTLTSDKYNYRMLSQEGNDE